MAIREIEVQSAEEPHPEIQTVIRTIENQPAPPLMSLDPNGVREAAHQKYPLPDDPEPVGEVMEFQIPGSESISIRAYVPDTNGPYPALIYLHGGGWVFGDLDLFDPVCRALANAAERLVVSVEYRLAPEHPFPAALKDAYAAAEWVIKHAEAMQINPNHVAIAGDSAGGGLTAAVTQLARNRNGPSFDRQVMIYPATNYSFETDSYEENAEGYLLTREAMQWFWKQYLRSDIDGHNQYASPLQATDFSDLPPATVVTCGFDPLRDEGAAYAGNLRDAGIDLNHHHYEDTIHGVLQMLSEPLNLTRAEEIVADIANDLTVD